MTVQIAEITEYADELLQSAITPDYPSALNGLQFENDAPITGIAAAVDFSSLALQETIEHGANLLVVHHGMFWNGLERVTGSVYRRQGNLFKNNVALYSSHLPLDRHPQIGNNVLLAKELGLEPTGGFARFQNIFIGVSGEADIETSAIASRADEFARRYGGMVRASTFGHKRRTRKWGICSGAGASTETLNEARRAKIDTLIVGEGPHWTAIYAEENDLAIIYAGHYATETLGIRALAQHLAEKFHLPWHFVGAPTGL